MSNCQVSPPVSYWSVASIPLPSVGAQNWCTLMAAWQREDSLAHCPFPDIVSQCGLEKAVLLQHQSHPFSVPGLSLLKAGCPS